MGKSLKAEDIQKRLPVFLKLIEKTYVHSKVPALFVDSEYGEFWMRWNDVQNGHGHKKRGIEGRTKKATRGIEQVKQQLPPCIKITENTYKNLKTLANFVDEDYGEFRASPESVINRGLRHPQHTKKLTSLSYKEVTERLPPYVKLDESSFVNIQTPATFFDDEYGEFTKKPYLIIYHKDKGHPTRGLKSRKEKAIRTSLIRYGTEYPMQHFDIASKSAKNTNKTQKLLHWKTGKELNCLGSYETKVVGWLNENRMNFMWQIPFRMPNGKLYICDLFLLDENKYVEIKGYFRGDGEEKWNWFHDSHPNSELWMKKELIEKGILP